VTHLTIGLISFISVILNCSGGEHYGPRRDHRPQGGLVREVSVREYLGEGDLIDRED